MARTWTEEQKQKQRELLAKKKLGEKVIQLPEPTKISDINKIINQDGSEIGYSDFVTNLDKLFNYQPTIGTPPEGVITIINKQTGENVETKVETVKLKRGDIFAHKSIRGLINITIVKELEDNMYLGRYEWQSKVEEKEFCAEELVKR